MGKMKRRMEEGGNTKKKKKKNKRERGREGENLFWSILKQTISSLFPEALMTCSWQDNVWGLDELSK